MKIDLEGKRALVCGSTAGIGKAVAVQLAAAGASVTLLARNEDKLKAKNKMAVAKNDLVTVFILLAFKITANLYITAIFLRLTSQMAWLTLIL